MNVLLLAAEPVMLDFALRCEAAGHHVRLVIHPQKDDKGKLCKTGDGMVEKVHHDEWKNSMGWADIVVVGDNTKWIAELDLFKKRGFPVWGASRTSADLELVRNKGQDLFAKAGINVMPFETFSDHKKAADYIIQQQKRFVSKPIGDADKALSYVSKSPRDLLFMLNRWNELGCIKGAFILQEFVPGIEMAVGGWLGRKGFSPWVCENMEFKKLMNDDFGPNTGEMGTLVRYTRHSTLAAEVLFPLERELIKAGHTGYVDVAVIVDESGSPRPLEFTCRPGWPLFNIQQVLHPEPVEWMVDVLDGNYKTFTPSTDTAAGVLLALPQFPYPTERKEVDGIPVYGLNKENPHWHFLHPQEVRLGEAPDDEGKLQKMIVASGNYVLIATGTGNTVCEATHGAYDVLDTIELPGSPIVRTDIGERLEEGLPELQKHGYALDWRYE